MSQPPPGEILYKPRAEEDLVSIWDYLAGSQSEEQAEAYLLKLELQIELLLSQPYMGRSAEELRPQLRRFLFQQHVVFYQPIEEGIEIIRILHGSQDIERYFKS